MVDLLSETGGIFPGSKIPFVPTKQLLHKVPLYDNKSKKWKVPEISRTEPKQNEDIIAVFLNKICDSIAKFYNVSQIRDWNSNFCNTPLSGSPISRKPDIILVDRGSRSAITWTSVRAIAEVTSQDGEPKRISNTVTEIGRAHV